MRYTLMQRGAPNYRSVKFEEEFYSKLKRIASVQRKKWAEKQTRGIGPRKRFTLPVRRHADVI